MPLEYDTDSLYIGGQWSAGTGRPAATWAAPSTEEVYGRSVRPVVATPRPRPHKTLSLKIGVGARFNPS